MLALCMPSQSSMTGFPHDQQNHFQQHPGWQHHPSPSDYSPPPWPGHGIDTSQPTYRDNYDHHQQQFTLAYRPRFDEYPFHPTTHLMVSPNSIAAPAPQTQSVGTIPSPHEYPEDPSFETGQDGRIEMNQDDVDAIIRNKRKVRDPKACYACHRRKVKCNRELPCDSCVKRDHPELCSYERPTKRRRIGLTAQMQQAESNDLQDPSQQGGPNITVPKEQWERLNRELVHLRGQVKSQSAMSEDAPSEFDDTHSGGYSPLQDYGRGDNDAGNNRNIQSGVNQNGHQSHPGCRI